MRVNQDPILQCVTRPHQEFDSITYRDEATYLFTVYDISTRHNYIVDTKRLAKYQEFIKQATESELAEGYKETVFVDMGSFGSCLGPYNHYIIGSDLVVTSGYAIFSYVKFLMAFVDRELVNQAFINGKEPLRSVDKAYIFGPGFLGNNQSFYPAIRRIGAGTNPFKVKNYNLDFHAPCSSVILAKHPLQYTYLMTQIWTDSSFPFYVFAAIDVAGAYSTAVNNSISESMSSLRSSTLLAYTYGTCLCMPLNLVSIWESKQELSSTSYLTNHGDWVRPLSMICNVNTLYTTIDVQFPMQFYTGFTLVGLMTEMGIGAQQNSVMTARYTESPTDKSYLMSCPACQESDYGTGGIKAQYISFSPASPWFNMINHKRGLCVAYVNKDLCADPVFTSISAPNPTEDYPEDPLFLTFNAPFPEEYMIMEGLATSKVLFRELTLQHEGGGNYLQAGRCDTGVTVYSGTIYTIKGADDWERTQNEVGQEGQLFGLDVNKWAIRLNNAGLHNFITADYKVTPASQNLSFLEVQNIGMTSVINSEFLISLSSTPTLSKIEELIYVEVDKMLKLKVGDRPKDPNIVISKQFPVYLVIVTVPSDEVPLYCKQEYHSYRRTSTAGIYVTPYISRNRYRLNVYRGLIQSVSEGTIHIYKYQIDFTANIYIKEEILQNKDVSEKDYALNGSLFTAGLGPPGNYNVYFTDDLQINCNGLSRLVSFPCVPAHSKVYFDENDNLIYTYDAENAIIYNIANDDIKRIELVCLRKIPDNPDDTIKLHIVSNMEAFVDFVKKINKE